MIAVYDCPTSCGLKLLGGETNYQTAKGWMDDFVRLNYEAREETIQPRDKIIQASAPHCTKASQDAARRWRVYPRGPAHYKMFVYTHAKSQKNIGVLIAEFIKEHGLGEVTESCAGGNPIHGDRPITVWVWSRDNDAFKNYAEELLLPKKEEKDAVS